MNLDFIKIGEKAFNSKGLRLAAKLCKPVDEKTLASFPTLKTQEVRLFEDISGNTKQIISYKDGQGKLLRRIRFNSNSPEISVSTYDWTHPEESTPYKAIFDRFALENHGLRKKTCSLNKKTGERATDFSVIDINDSNRILTQTRDISKETADGKIYDALKIESKTDGKLQRQIQQTSKREGNGLNEILETKSFGIDDKDLKDFAADKYFYARFKDEPDFLFALKPRAYTNQGISLETPLSIIKSDRMASAFASEDGICFLKRTLMKKAHKGQLISTLEHESKHIHQHDLVKKLINNELTNPEEIKMAKLYAENFKNYIPMEIDHKAYENQLVEKEAYAVGEEVYPRYRTIANKLGDLFPFSRAETTSR